MPTDPKTLSPLSEALGLKYPILTLRYAKEIPPGARTFKKAAKGSAHWGCAMYLLAQAFKGATCAFSAETSHCPGAAAGMGLKIQGPPDFPGGPMGFANFLSSGNKESEEGRKLAEDLKENGLSEELLEAYLDGEGYKKSPDLVFRYMGSKPEAISEDPVLIISPLTEKDREDPPRVALALADALQLSALTVLANYASEEANNVRFPMASGCQSVAAIPLSESLREKPQAVVGLIDITVRRNLSKFLGRDLLSFAVPWKLFREMEDNVEESFLSRLPWKRVKDIA
jgi:hypothetical protein